ncbi:MAG: hypothetical protein KMY55_13285 [Dethiosulfatibacter sp.]|nr:hypothetical protein [Dethiosulfatibacter sp.]
MFDLESNVTAWSDQLRSNGKLSEEDVMELEGHLREQVDELIEKGLMEDEAFLISIKRLGNLNILSKEYSKVNIDDFWKQLLLDSDDPIASKKSRRNVLLIVLFSLLAGTSIRLTTLLGVDIESLTFFKNLSFFILPLIVLFFGIMRGVSKKLISYVLGIFLVTAVIINLYPSYSPNHTEMLTGIHLPIMLWMVTGVAYMGQKWRLGQERMNFIRFTGESIIYGSLIVLGSIVLMLFIVVIFETIAIDISDVVLNYIIIYGGCAVVMVTVYLAETKKSVVENFAPILAKLFSPLFLVVMLAFLSVMVITGKSPFVDRDFLIGFDLMLVLVLGMVLYTISARNIYHKSNIFDYLNVALIVTAIVVDTIALTAIISRLSVYGVSPNKLAALGENILLFINLAGLLWLYIKYFKSKIEFSKIESWQTTYLSVYAIWMAVVVFVFPIIFKFQ